MLDLGGRDWVVEQRRRKWQWAGHIAMRVDGSWGRELLDWMPIGRRSKGRPVTKWTSVLKAFFKTQGGDDLPDDFWKFQALDMEIWNTLETGFLEFCK